MPLCVEIFFPCKLFCLCLFWVAVLRIDGFWGLTCDFWAKNAKKNATAKNNGEMRGFSAAPLTECVNSFGRNDDSLGGGRRTNNDNSRSSACGEG